MYCLHTLMSQAEKVEFNLDFCRQGTSTLLLRPTILFVAENVSTQGIKQKVLLNDNFIYYSTVITTLQ
jgi:hypothetical protein